MDGDPKHLYFTLGPTSAIIIPTSAFVTPHGAEQFLSAARQHAEAAHTRLSVSEASGRAADFLPEPEDGIFPNPRVRFFLSPDDVVRYYRLVGRGYLVRAIILTLVVAGGILLSITALFRVNLLDALPIIAVDFVLLVGVTAWRVDRDRRRRAALHGATEQTLILTAQGIEERMPFTVGRTPWEKIRAITETPTLFLMVFGPQHSVVIPKRAFGSAEEARVFFQNAQAFRQAALTGTDAPPVEQVASWPPPPRR